MRPRRVLSLLGCPRSLLIGAPPVTTPRGLRLPGKSAAGLLCPWRSHQWVTLEEPSVSLRWSEPVACASWLVACPLASASEGKLGVCHGSAGGTWPAWQPHARGTSCQDSNALHVVPNPEALEVGLPIGVRSRASCPSAVPGVPVRPTSPRGTSPRRPRLGRWLQGTPEGCLWTPLLLPSRLALALPPPRVGRVGPSPPLGVHEP